ncbi:MAG: M23 family metallopeptidase [Brachybacterium tyrofermentans]|uniref:M23 family metallopeptidase n=1 Tax=Brachybacterium tyrofermentans TaxID=47848 RepID=UPI000A1A7188|nr:M23 family metallopeptidase [Brachybacterium tyrofermentans]SLN02630.1 possible secreted peptidase [Corynebacterium xerosis]
MAALELAHPGTGLWSVRNSPADRVPSHGTTLFATAQAIDLVPVGPDGRTAPFGLRSLLRPEPAHRFPGFGRTVLAPVAGVVVAAHGSSPDHPAHRGLPSVGYALTQRRRAAGGWEALAGNHVILRTTDGEFIALCHLRHGSLRVRSGEQVRVGQELGECGNSGNSMEPHLHLQAMTSADASSAEPVPVVLPSGLPRNGSVIDAG